jgi:hypothetical protein
VSLAGKKSVFIITTVRLNYTKLLRKLSSKLIEWFGFTMTAQSMYSVWMGAAHNKYQSLERRAHPL